MKKSLKNILKNLFVVIFICLIIPFQTEAIGQISKPIEIKDALRGGNYQEEIVIFNTEKADFKIGLSASGDIKDWVKFYNTDNATTTVSEVDIKAGNNLKVNAVINIPSSQPNGQYKGLISATSKPKDLASSTESQVSMSQKIDRPVSITVSDNQILKFDVSVIPKDYDLKTGDPLSVRMIYDNQGNVNINPQMQVKISKDNNTISNLIYPYPENTPPVKPNSRYEITPIVIQTAGFEKGQYSAEFNFLINGESKLSKQFSFSSGIYEKNAIATGININIKMILSAVLIFLIAGSIFFISKYLKAKKINFDIENDNQ